MSNPKFSIITVSYNSMATIERTIKSVLGQTEQDFEYLLIDGASTDGTAELIRDYAARFPGKIRYVSEKDGGIYNAMNKGIRMSRGYMIGILNSDDWYERDTLEKVAEHFREEEEYVLYGMVRFMNGDQPDRVILNCHQALGKRMLLHPGCFVTRKTYSRYGCYKERYRSAADYECFLRLERAGVPFIPVYSLLANFSLGGMSSSYQSFREEDEILRKYGYLNWKQYLRRRVVHYLKSRL